MLKRSLAQVMGVVAAAPGDVAPHTAKKRTAKEIPEEDIRLGLEQTRKNLEEASSASEGGSDFDDHGSKEGIPSEVAAEDDLFASREAAHAVMEEIAREKERGQREDDAAEEAADSSVEEVEFVLHGCPAPTSLKVQKGRRGTRRWQ